RGTKFVGPSQFQVGGYFNSLIGKSGRSLLRAITTRDTDELRFFELGHDAQIGLEGTKIGFAARRTESEPGFTLEPIGIETDSVSGDITVSHPFRRSRARSLLGHIKLSYRDTETDTLNVPFTEDRIRALRFGIKYDFVDRFRGVSLINAELSQGLDIFNATETGELGLSRADGHSDFTKLTAEFLRIQPIAPSWNFLIGTNLQYAADPLLAAEEFALGGAYYGRAYDPAEIAGDHGASLKTEIQFSRSGRRNNSRSYQLFVFYDVGAVWNKDSPANVSSRSSLASAGFGVRFKFSKHFSGSFEAAVPLTREVAAEGEDGDEPRAFFNLVGTF
ncbi:MAG: BamA/TamA family outer membrane protein, partial [Gammaproteobacteria bacterium]|nr:BamA/TamA family outer membrane protein [Gammaproteobacteria bacterium]